MLLSNEPIQANPETPAANSIGISLRGLVKTFEGPHGPVRAVRGIDVEIAVGETLALLGPNGAGKSTTLDMLLGLQRPDRGEVVLFGSSPEAMIEAGRVGAMLQVGELLRDVWVRELVEMMASVYPDPLDVDEVLALTGIEAIADQRTQQLSGGESQRVRFALALVANPELLVLDEPTVGMDVEGRRAFWKTMRAFAARGKTVIFATHYLEEADAYADRAVMIANGAVVADAPTTEIKAMVGVRTIRATLANTGLSELSRLPGVIATDRHGKAIILTCSDSDLAIRALLQQYPQTRDIEIAGAGLEQAFLALTGDGDADETSSRMP